VVFIRPGRSRRPVLALRARRLRGLSLATSREQMVRAVVEGIAARGWPVPPQPTSAQPLARLRVDGGLTRLRSLMQVQADLLQAAVEVYPSPHATAMVRGRLRRHRRWCRARSGDLAPAAVYEPGIGADEAEERAAVASVVEATMEL
jgi:hypothetical protein